MYVAAGGTNLRTILILRTMSRHAQLGGWGDKWCEDDYVVRGQAQSVGRIYKEMHGNTRWGRSIVPPPHDGVVTTLDAAKEEFKADMRK
jgi:hypothetical protein